MDIILHRLSDPLKDKVGKCTSAKELWDKLEKFYTKGYLHQEHEGYQNERPNTNNEEHPESNHEISKSNASEDKEDSEIEGFVDLEVELISILDELKEEKNKN